MLVIQSKFKNTKPLDTPLHWSNEVDQAEKSAPIEIVHLQTLKISLNSLKQKYWDFCDTIFKIKSTYQIILISNAVTKLLFQEFVSYQSNSYSYIPFKGWTPNQSAYFVIVLWLYIIYFWSVPTHYTWGTYFLIMWGVCETFFHRLISVIFCSFCRSVIFITKFKDFYTFQFLIFNPLGIQRQF